MQKTKALLTLSRKEMCLITALLNGIHDTSKIYLFSTCILWSCPFHSSSVIWNSPYISETMYAFQFQIAVCKLINDYLTINCFKKLIKSIYTCASGSICDMNSSCII